MVQGDAENHTGAEGQFKDEILHKFKFHRIKFFEEWKDYKSPIKCNSINLP